MIAVCIPTRGVVFTEVMQAVSDNLEGRAARVFTTKDQGLPDCMNDLVTRALAAGANHIWVVEEDTVPPTGVLDRMLTANADYIACDYPVMDGHTCFGFDDDGLLWTGLGCTLIRADVFRAVPEPWFESNMNAVLVRRFGLDYFTADPHPVEAAGGHDISFCSKLKDRGMRVQGLPGEECRHLRLRSWNTGRSNHAWHDIASQPVIQTPWTEYLARIDGSASLVPTAEEVAARAPQRPLWVRLTRRLGRILNMSRGA